jgi:hypothetical protein
MASILEELRRKAEEKKISEEVQTQKEAHLERIYQAELLPKMQRLFNSIQELLRHLEVIAEPLLVKDYCKSFPQLGVLQQTHYKINTDGRMGMADFNRLMEINIHFICEGQGSFQYKAVSNLLIKKEVEYLHSKRLSFDWRRETASDGNIIGVFTVKRYIPISFRIAVDFPQSKLNVSIHNHENFESLTRSFTANEFDDDTLDALLSYLMRKDRRFVQYNTISDEQRAAIRESLIKDADRLQQSAKMSGRYAGAIPHRYEVEPDAPSAPKSNPIEKLFSKYTKK